MIAGHLDTVPLNDNLPARLEDGVLHGLGTCDMKGGDAVMLKLAADVTEPNRDLTFIFYEAEEVDSVHNGLRKLTDSDPDLVEADFAILMEPSNAVDRGRLPGHDARRRTHDRRAGPQRPQLEGRQRHPPRRPGPGAAQRLRRPRSPRSTG